MSYVENIDDDILLGKGIEIKLKDEDAFLKVKETLTRMGVASKKTKTLCQSAHILHKKGRYFILHFKEMLELDGKISDISETDIARRNTIAKLLQDWNLVDIIDEMDEEDKYLPINQLKIIPYKEKGNWILTNKYNVGGSKVKQT